jgi:hypothetical protein
MSETRLNELMKSIESLGHGTPEYHDAMAFLLFTMAKRQGIIADSIRQSRRDSERRRQRAAATRASRGNVQDRRSEA